jgi:hypothetical protein
MEDNIKSISTDLFYKVRSRFSGLKLGSETGEVTMNPEEAAFFDFDYMENGNPLGHVSISIAEPGNMKVYYSTDITETMDDGQKVGWYEFLKGLREFAKRRLMSFDTRDISKDNLDKRDFAFLTQNSNSGIGESVMKEGMYGSSKTSYQKLENTTLIIKHNKQVDETQPGSRARNILGLFIENSQGERFKYPFIHLAGARAMQRHVQEGGLPYDDVGRYLISMSEQIAQLKNFGNYVVRNDLMNSETNDIVERSSTALNRLREEIKKLSKRNYYQQFKEQFTSSPQEEIPQDVIEDLTNKFTVRNFKEDIKDVFPVIYKLMKEAETASNELGYDDIVEMTSTMANEDAEIDLTPELEDPFEQFEAWAYSLGEEGGISSQDEQEQQAAIKNLQSLVGQHFPAGADGTNAIESLKGIIDDPTLEKAIKQASMKDSDTCVRPLIYNWLKSNAPEVLDSLDFGDMDSAKESNDETPQQKQSVGMREVAEFISSFYDKESGTFPKGPEGVAIMVGKKFGEQAENVARKFVERMAPQQSTNQNPELAELARIGELAGVSEGPIDSLKAAGKAVGSAVGGAVTGVKKFFHKTAQHAVDEFMKSKYPGKTADTSAKKDEIIGLYLIDKEILDQSEVEKLKQMLAGDGGLFQACMDLKCDFNNPEGGRNPGKLLKDILYPEGNIKKDAEGNVTSFRMKPQEDAQDLPDELSRIRELSGLQSSEVVTQEAAGNYMWQEVGDEADQRQLSKMADRLVKMYQRNAESSASDEEIMSVIDDVVREFVPQVGKLNNIVPVAQAFFDKLPIKEPEPEYDDDGEEMEPESDVRGDFITNIWSMVKITAAAEKGDTSSYGYKVHPNLNKESSTPELEDIRRLSGISQGIMR